MTTRRVSILIGIALGGTLAGPLPGPAAARQPTDGVPTRSEVTPPRRTGGMEGDGAAAVMHWRVAPVVISESDWPVRVIEAEAADGRPTRAWWRKPRGDGPHPAIVFIHGGLAEFPAAALRRHLTANPVITRFLAAGYAVVMATFRTYEQDVQSRGPIDDVRAVRRFLDQAMPGRPSARCPIEG